MGAGELTLEAADGDENASLVVSPGVGFRIPLGGHLQVRLDGRFVSRRAAGTFAGAEPGNLAELAAALGIGF